MRDYFCEFLELDLEVASEFFDKDAYFEDVKDNINIEKQVHSWSYGSKDKPEEQHAHIIIDFRNADKYRLRVTYHGFGGEDTDTRPPYMEDCAHWLGQFMKGNEFSADLAARFIFDEGYSPVISLPFPLLSPNDDLAGAQVIGIRIKLPRRMNVKNVILQKGESDRV
jgi:hypothetical protein